MPVHQQRTEGRNSKNFGFGADLREAAHENLCGLLLRFHRVSSDGGCVCGRI